METKTYPQGTWMLHPHPIEAPEEMPPEIGGPPANGGLPDSGNSPTDDELAAAAGSDPACFAALYRRYLGRVYRYFYGRTGCTADAEDLTAQLFLDVLKALPRYRPQGTFAPWLFTLARRRAADYHRQPAPAFPLEWAEEAAAGGGSEGAAESAAESGDPLGAVLQAEQRSRLGQLFARLDDERQELIRLRYGAGLTHRQVGEVMGRSEAAVAMALHRTLHWFQQNWEAQDE